VRRRGFLFWAAPLLWASPLAAEPVVAPPGTGPAVIEVTGSAIVTVLPDQATVPLTVQNAAEISLTATKRTEQEAARVIAFARTFGATEADIQQDQVRMMPRTRPASPSTPAPKIDGAPAAPNPAQARVPDGFEATTNIRVRFRDLDKAARFAREAGDNGATRVNTTIYGVLDAAAGADKARHAAFHAARRKAERLAEIAGLKLGRVVRITVPTRDFMSLMAGGASRPIEGMQTDDVVRVTLDVPKGVQTTEVRASLDVAWVAE